MSVVTHFRHLGSQLTELEKAINTIVANEFLSFITQDLNKPLAEVSAAIDEVPAIRSSSIVCCLLLSVLLSCG